MSLVSKHELVNCFIQRLILLTSLAFVTINCATKRCDDTWIKLDDKCVYLVHFGETFVEAESTCRIFFGGQLVTIPDERTQAHLKSLLSRVGRVWSNYIWIGAHSARGSRFQNYTWIDGRPVTNMPIGILDYLRQEYEHDETFDNEHYGGFKEEEHPTMELATRSTCMSIQMAHSSRSGNWWPQDCGDELPFMCEKPSFTKNENRHRQQINETVISVNPLLVAILVLFIASCCFVFTRKSCQN